MHTISEKSNGSVFVNGEPYNVGDFSISYKGNPFVEIRSKLNERLNILKASYTEITNPITTAPFASFQALKDFIQANFFDEATSEGGVTETELAAGVNNAKRYADGKTPWVTPEMFGDTSTATDTSAAFQAAFDFLFANEGGELRLSGNYEINIDIRYNSTGDYTTHPISIVGSGGTSIKKSEDFPDDGYIFQFRKCNGATVTGVTFEGNSPTINEANFGDGCIAFTSSKNILVNGNRFSNFGDGVIKVSSTSINNTPTDVESSNVLIQGNLFYNCFQTSTTSGGAESYIMCNNIFQHSRIKFATRYNVANRVIIVNNILKSYEGVTSPIEVVGYSNVLIEGNSITDSLGSYAVNIYNNTLAVDDLISENIKVTNNTIANCKGGVRFDNNTQTNGFKNLFRNLNIYGNIIDGIFDNAGVNLVNGSFEGVNIYKNYIKTTNAIGVTVSIFATDDVNSIENICIEDNTIDAASTIAVRVTVGGIQPRKIKGVDIVNNKTIGSLFFTNIENFNFSQNEVKITGGLVSQTDNLTNSFIRNNRFDFDAANGFNLITCSGIDIAFNNSTGTAPNYHLRLDATCSGDIKDTHNTFGGVVARNVAAVFFGSGTASPLTNIVAKEGSIYQQTNGVIWQKSVGVDALGWVALLGGSVQTLGNIGTGTSSGTFRLTASTNDILIDTVGVSSAANIFKNRADLNNGYFTLGANGFRFQRTVAGSSQPAFEIDQNSPTATGNILNLRFNATIKSGFTKDGIFDSPTIIPNIDFASVAAGTRIAAPSTETFTGAVEGDIVLVQGPNTGLVYSGYVTATDTITLYAYNPTAAPIDPASGSFKITVIK